MASQRLVIFDMDGTLTRPMLDFDGIRAEIGLPKEPLLEAVMALPPEDRARAESILLRHEARAAAESELQPGAKETIDAIRRARIPVALMTRNSRSSTKFFDDRHGLVFDHVRTREDGELKPSPVPVLDICRRFEVAPADTWVIGDFHFDLICANAAGATSVLFWGEGAPLPEWAKEARHVITALPELLELMGLK